MLYLLSTIIWLPQKLLTEFRCDVVKIILIIGFFSKCFGSKLCTYKKNRSLIFMKYFSRQWWKNLKHYFICQNSLNATVIYCFLKLSMTQTLQLSYRFRVAWVETKIMYHKKYIKRAWQLAVICWQTTFTKKYL